MIEEVELIISNVGDGHNSHHSTKDQFFRHWLDDLDGFIEEARSVHARSLAKSVHARSVHARSFTLWFTLAFYL